MVPIGASSPPAKHWDFQLGPQLIFQEGVGRQHLLLAGGEGTVGMMPHHAAHGQNTHIYWVSLPCWFINLFFIIFSFSPPFSSSFFSPNP